MATKKYLSLNRLTEYDELIKAKIDDDIANHKHSWNDFEDKPFGEVDGELIELYPTTTLNLTMQREDFFWGMINGLNSGVFENYKKIRIVFDGTNYDFSDANSAYFGNSYFYNPTKEEDNGLPFCLQKNLDLDTFEWIDASLYVKTQGAHTLAVYAIESSVVTLDEKYIPNTIARTLYVDSMLSDKASVYHNHDDVYDVKGAASTALDEAKSYADEKVANLLDNSTEAVDSIMELAEAMENNADAIEALETVAASKVPTSRKVNGKALTSDITLSASDVGADASGSAGAVQTNLDTHIADAVKHITATERTNWGAAYTHSTSAHAPSNAQANVIESIKVNGTAQTITSKSVNITVPTDNSQLANGAGYITSSAIANKADKSTTLSGYGITNAYTKSEVDAIADGKSASGHKHKVVDITDLTATATELNYMDGVTSNVQTQLDGKATTSALTTHTNNADIHFTAAERTKLSGIDTGANKITVDSALSSTSTNPVQNKVVHSTITTATSAITANTNSINAHTSRIEALESKVGDGFAEITSAEIQALFA